MINNISDIMNGQQIPDNIKSMLENMMNNANRNSESSSESSSGSSSAQSSNNSFNPGNIDINTIFKIQNIMNSINNDKENEYRTNLLLSLKPYLKNTRQEKVDQFIKFMKMEKVIEAIGPLTNSNNDNQNL